MMISFFFSAEDEDDDDDDDDENKAFSSKDHDNAAAAAAADVVANIVDAVFPGCYDAAAWFSMLSLSSSLMLASSNNRT